MLTNEGLDLTGYDLILVNTSGGKDSAVAAWYVTRLAELAGVKDRVLAVHATFPEEWEGTVDLVKRQTQELGIPLVVVERGEGLLDYVERRGMWPSSEARYCTSEFKRGPIDKVITAQCPARGKKGPNYKVLNVLGMRAAESPARSKMVPFELNSDRSTKNGKRVVWDWLPIFRLTDAQVWQVIREQGLEMHPAYKAGMPRLSCCFCIFAPREALLKAGELNPALLAKYVAVEQRIGHSFKADLRIADIQAALEQGERAQGVDDWKM